MVDDACHNRIERNRHRLYAFGIDIDLTGRKRRAECIERTLGANGFCGFTDQGTEFHHRLIEDSRRIPIQECRCRFLECHVSPGAIYRRIHDKQPGNHPLDISIHDRKRLIKGNAENCRGDVVSHPRKLSEGIPVSGNLTAIAGSYLNGGFMKVTGPAVISQALPEFKHILLIREGKRLNRRESFQKTVVIGNHGFNLSLLKHDFRNPNRIRLQGLSPRKVSVIVRVPGMKAFSNK